MFAVYVNSTGQLVSVGSTVAPTNVLAQQGLGSKDVGDPTGKVWNTTLKKFEDPPAPDPDETHERIVASKAALQDAITLLTDLDT